jgi:hypothetical protein
MTRDRCPGELVVPSQWPMTAADLRSDSSSGSPGAIRGEDGDDIEGDEDDAEEQADAVARRA